ncbi:MAG TPA: hypothetical protein VF793_19780 [Telluria sp.]|jgi:hypothetical protein
MTKSSLAARRLELIERCAEQRTGLAYELKALRPSNALGVHPVLAKLAANRTVVLGALGGGLGIALLGRKRLSRLAGTAGTALRTWKMVRGALGMLRLGSE